MRQLTILFAAASVLSGCASLGTTNLARSTDGRYTGAEREIAMKSPVVADYNEQSSRGAEMVHVDPSINRFPQIIMPGQGAEGMPQSLNSLPVGASNAY